MNTNDAIILNIERSAPQSTERVFSVVNPSGESGRKLRVAAYCRVSSDSDDQMNSYLSQMRYYTQVITENPDWELVDIYADEAESGLSTNKRTDFQRLMEDCRKGKIDRILCKSVSRFARNYSECIANVRKLKQLGVSVLFEKEGIDTAVMNGEMFLSLQALKAQRESMSLSGNMKRGNQMRMKNGTFTVPTAPYGYRLNGKTLEIIPKQAEVVKRIFADYLSGKGCALIADSLNKENIPRHYSSSKWYHTAVRYILGNISYTGDAIWQKTYTLDTVPIRQITNKGERRQYYVTNDHSPIISREDFDKVQMLLSERKAVYYNVNENSAKIGLLSKKVFCGECGTMCRCRVINNKTYWQCRTHDSDRTLCSVSQIPESEILKAFERMMDKLRYYADYIAAPMAEQLERIAERKQRGDSELSELNRTMSDLAGQLHALNRLHGKGIMDSKLFMEKSNELNKKLSEARQTKARIITDDRHYDKAQAVMDFLDALISDADAQEQIPESDKTELFAAIVDRVIVHAEDRLIFKLKCGMELTETIERAVRFGGLASQDSIRLYGC